MLKWMFNSGRDEEVNEALSKLEQGNAKLQEELARQKEAHEQEIAQLKQNVKLEVVKEICKEQVKTTDELRKLHTEQFKETLSEIRRFTVDASGVSLKKLEKLLEETNKRREEEKETEITRLKAEVEELKRENDDLQKSVVTYSESQTDFFSLTFHKRLALTHQSDAQADGPNPLDRIKDSMDSRGVIDILWSQEILTDIEKGYIESRDTLMDMNWALLLKIKEKGWKGLMSFGHALTATNQEHIYNLVMGNDVSPDQLPMSNENITLLRKWHIKLVQNLEINHLLDEMFTVRLLEKVDYDELKLKTEQEQNRKFLEILRRKPNGCLQWLCDRLCKDTQHDIVKMLGLCPHGREQETESVAKRTRSSAGRTEADCYRSTDTSRDICPIHPLHDKEQCINNMNVRVREDSLVVIGYGRKRFDFAKVTSIKTNGNNVALQYLLRSKDGTLSPWVRPNGKVYSDTAHVNTIIWEMETNVVDLHTLENIRKRCQQIYGDTFQKPQQRTRGVKRKLQT